MKGSNKVGVRSRLVCCSRRDDTSVFRRYVYTFIAYLHVSTFSQKNSPFEGSLKNFFKNFKKGIDKRTHCVYNERQKERNAFRKERMITNGKQSDEGLSLGNAGTVVTTPPLQKGELNMSFEHWNDLQELNRLKRKEAHRTAAEQRRKETFLLLLDAIGTMAGLLIMLGFIYVMLIAFFG